MGLLDNVKLALAAANSAAADAKKAWVHEDLDTRVQRLQRLQNDLDERQAILDKRAEELSFLEKSQSLRPLKNFGFITIGAIPAFLLGFAAAKLGMMEVTDTSSSSKSPVFEVQNIAETALPVTNSLSISKPEIDEKIEVPSDPLTDYRLVYLSTMADGHKLAVTQRSGSSGNTYARREIDCSGNRFRYLGEGSTFEDAMSDSLRIDAMGELIPGSISSEVSSYVCSR